jgi:glycosyltransferase involved in cell wall biosynthesis
LNDEKLISIICPIYNEEESIVYFLENINQLFKNIKYNYEIIFINDGSFDNSLNILLDIQKKQKNIKIIDFSRNFGKEQALTAGLDFCKGDAIIPIDVDLQDPPELIYDFIEYWEKGEDIVLGKRINRTEDSCFKAMTANLFYKFHNKISDINIPENVGDFRLISRKVAESIKLLPENQRFMKGIFSWVGYNTKIIEYSRQKRNFGKSKFNGWKLWNFALDGITSFSTLPLKIWTYVGFVVSFIAFIYANFIIFNVILKGTEVPGYASTIVIVLFLGGLQLMGIGILGEYIGRIFMETKKRPLYIINKIYEL